MRTITVCQKTGPDGVLNLSIPLGIAQTECEVVVIVQSVAKVPCQATPEELGYEPGFIEETAGSIDDETFYRPDPGLYTVPLSFD